ncbi:hypothetical protein [Haloarcula argentinensis]|uniref:Transposase n=1 Tax=Haloarcula argentinensis TaxID=43776 RepID=A0ABU2EYA2_HALAR|nr:hypothetical protein [Haloarcula argentinensis]EMA24637.1 hypothetical protein C443_05744 [Haloarcula argentinensis DSM 12282]MDS0253248.1 hypothetical protein [Haloarcula argentinensis]
MIGKESVADLTAVLANVVSWVAHTEQIWFPMAAAYARYLEPVYGLPDIRGPLAFITLTYMGLRLADLWDAKDDAMEEMT